MMNFILNYGAFIGVGILLIISIGYGFNQVSDMFEEQKKFIKKYNKYFYKKFK
jgi:hypothetical protein